MCLLAGLRSEIMASKNEANLNEQQLEDIDGGREEKDIWYKVTIRKLNVRLKYLWIATWILDLSALTVYLAKSSDVGDSDYSVVFIIWNVWLGSFCFFEYAYLYVI